MPNKRSLPEMIMMVLVLGTAVYFMNRYVNSLTG